MITLPERFPRENGRDYALRTIKESIINLELEPGSQISESEIAAQLGSSRTPVREALIELSKVKIIHIHPQKKSTVSLIDYDMVEEVRFMRNLLECAVVELDCEMAAKADLNRLEANVQLQKFYLNNNILTELLPLDNQFHKILFEIAKKPQVYIQIRNFSIHFDRVRNMSLFAVKQDTKIVQDHEDILRAISRKDPKTAQALMEVHLNRHNIDEAEIRAAYPQYFK